MIDANKHNCCGCSACSQRCPVQCITMVEDSEGFLYPQVDLDKCVNCGLCKQVCPCRNQREPQEPVSVKAAINADEKIRRQSSSGGIFSLLAEAILKKGGIVFGAKFDDNWEVEHSYTETVEGLAAFMGSKYVQSSIGDSFSQAEAFLREGREVLFSGTPCQIAGLRLFLQKDYNKLITVAIACHSVPSPLVWREYLKSLRLRDISEVWFRDKHISWEQYGLSITHKNGRVFFQRFDQNPFMQLFLHGFTTRPSCFYCPAKEGRSRADIILCDCWGISRMLPDYPNDHQGISLVLCQSYRGLQAAESAGIKGPSLPYDQVIAHNGGLTIRSVPPKDRPAFWTDFHVKENKRRVINRYARQYLPGFNTRLKSFIKRKRNK